MTDSMDEWDGGAIDGRDQYLADAPYWTDGDGETVDGTDPNATGEMTTENVPDPGDEPERDDTDESETEAAEVPVWPPNPETLTEIRQRLLDGESTREVAEWVGTTDNPVRYAAKGTRHRDVAADIPPLTAEGERRWTTWTVDETETEPETETTDSEAEPESETDTADNGVWPETGTSDTEEEPESGPGQQESGLVSGDERPVARDPPEPETPTVPTRWIVVGVAFVAGWTLSRLVRGGASE